MKFFKYTFLLFAFLFSSFCFAQTTTISQILKQTLQRENQMRQMVYTETDAEGNEIGLIQEDTDSLEVTELFTIENDTLYYTTKHALASENGYYSDQQKVALKDIAWVVKDIGIFFETAPDKVILTRNEYVEEGNQLKQITTSNLFRTHFVSVRDNEYVADELIKAFKKAGFRIKKGHWFD
jgi:hypothetical protein